MASVGNAGYPSRKPERKWLWAAPLVPASTQDKQPTETTNSNAHKSMGVGDVICGADGVSWGRVIKKLDSSWQLDSGALVKTSQVGITWQWQALDLSDMPPLQHVAPPKPCCKRSFGESSDGFEFRMKSEKDKTPCRTSSDLLQVKKHSTMGCAIVTLSDTATASFVIEQGESFGRGKYLHHIHGTPCEFRQHVDKSSGALMPGAIFVGWGHQSERTHALHEEDIAAYVRNLLARRVSQSRFGSQVASSHQQHSSGRPVDAPQVLALTVSSQSRISTTLQGCHGKDVVAKRAVSHARTVLQKRAEKRGRSLSRPNRRHARSLSGQGRAPEEPMSDAMEDCLDDIVKRAELLATLQEALDAWTNMAVSQSKFATEIPVQSFAPGSEVELKCFPVNARYMWAYHAKVIDADFERIEVMVDGAEVPEVIDWAVIRNGLLKIKHSTAVQVEPGPLQQVRKILEKITSQSFKCTSCIEDHQQIFGICNSLQQALFAAEHSVSQVSEAAALVVKLREQFLVWTASAVSVPLPLSEIGYTHDCISNRFRQGDQDPELDPAQRGPCGRGIESLVTDLISGKSSLEEDKELELEVVFYHGRHRSLNNRRLWAFKQYAEHLGHDVQIKTRRVALLPEARMRNGNAVLPKFFDANSSTNNGNEVRFRGSPPPLAISRPSKLVNSPVPSASPLTTSSLWERLLDGEWVDESGEEVAVVAEGLMKCVFSQAGTHLQIESRPWPLACYIDGERWEGAILEHGDCILWEDGHRWLRKNMLLCRSDPSPQLLMFKILADTARYFSTAATDFFTLLLNELNLKSNSDISMRMLPKEKRLLIACTTMEILQSVSHIAESKNTGYHIHFESCKFPDLSKEAQEKAKQLYAFLERRASA